jgi:excisionase family DNA binding protein
MTEISAESGDGAWSVNGFVQQYGISRSKLYAEIREGRLTAKKRGKTTLIPRDEAARWFKSLPDWTPVKDRPKASAA